MSDCHSPQPLPLTSILVLGAGELGLAVLRALRAYISNISHLPNPTPTLTVLLRPQTSSRSNTAQTATLHNLNVNIIRHEISSLSTQELADVFAPYDAVLSCMGFSTGADVGKGSKKMQFNITEAIILSSKLGKGGKKKRYIPWQFGVDYDVLGRGSGQDVFDEQLNVRALLRSSSQPAAADPARGDGEQGGVDWIIVTTGVFLSFFFTSAFGIVDGIDLALTADKTTTTTIANKVTVRALRSWKDEITVTSVDDIGTLTARILFDARVRNEVVFVGGETISYERLGDVVEAVLRDVRRGAQGGGGGGGGGGGITTGDVEVRREVWTEEVLEREADEEPEDGLRKYRVAFAKGRGVAWEMERCYNTRKGIETVNVESYLRKSIGQ